MPKAKQTYLGYPAVAKKAAAHLKGDIQGQKKQRKKLKQEISEDKKLLKQLKSPKRSKLN